ncbi:hypothetical protein LSCM1_02735 [Leishmania martiniquensis]|uniref:MYND-type domain-containing protein n=1 Tax=Leishmania martiniquensis TaxID=1580590 RepID=A0A836FUE4_9TRYP|nr:hypothetical protein LSCM1_02735 [Leishmania martiniquensis]
MSLLETFLRGGTPCATLSELTEVLSSARPPYAHWRCVAYYPRRWHHDAVDNRITAPVFFLLFGHQEGREGSDSDRANTHKGENAAVPEATWHLLYHTVLPEGAIPLETFTHHRKAALEAEGRSDAQGAGGEGALVSSGGGGVGALRVLLRAVPASLMPSGSLEWYSVADGIAYERMGLLTSSLFLTKLAPAVGEVLSKHWRPVTCSLPEAGTGEPPRVVPRSPQSVGHYVLDGAAREVVDFICGDAGSSAALAARRRGSGEDVSVIGRVSSSSLLPSSASKMHFITVTVHEAVQWMCAQRGLAALVADASAPSITEAGWRSLYPLMTVLQPCMYTSFFEEAGHVGQSKDAPLGADVESLTGLARLRAERDAGIAQWKKQIGDYTSFTVPEEYSTVTADVASAVPSAEGAGTAASLAPSAVTPVTAATATSAERSYQHVLLLQRPIVTKKSIDVNNRDAGPLSPQPVGAELHLMQDRGDVGYALEQLADRANMQFVYEDTMHDDGEVLVQLTPVEGVPFCDLEEYFSTAPATSAALHAGAAAQYSGSCCPAVLPRVVYRRPTGKAQKANPIAHAVAEVEVASPTPAMVKAAAAALVYVSSQLVEVGGPATSLSAASCTAGSSPEPGYTLNVPSVDFSAVSRKKCGWCGRRREVLLRCGVCKAVSYCCKRHQALDWKEGTHKLECKLWRRARELQERTVAPWMMQSPKTWTVIAADGKLSSFPKNQGWSCAATLATFLSDIDEAARGARLKSPSTDNAAQYIHVVGLDTECVSDFVRSLAEDCHVREVLASLTSGAAGGVRQYRVLACSDTFTDTQKNSVWAIRRTNTGSMWLTPATGVLGDAWHCKGSNEAATQPTSVMVLIRLSGVKYHNVERHLDVSREGCPRAVLSFGPASGEGCSYLTAALEVFAEHDVGVVPVRLVDSSYVGATRTRSAIAARVASSDRCTAATKSRVAVLVNKAKEAEAAGVLGGTDGSLDTSSSPFSIRFNTEGAVSLGELEESVAGAGCTPAGPPSAPAMTPCLNCFLWDVSPADFRCAPVMAHAID